MGYSLFRVLETHPFCLQRRRPRLLVMMEVGSGLLPRGHALPSWPLSPVQRPSTSGPWGWQISGSNLWHSPTRDVKEETELQFY